MSPIARSVQITDDQDSLLLELQLNSHIHPKVRLRASILRLHKKGWNAPQLAQHFKRNLQSVHNDLTRFEQQGMLGLADQPKAGRPAKITPRISQYLRHCLSENRLWHAELLVEEIAKKFNVQVSSEAVRQRLHEMGYSWKRARYSPGKELDPEVKQEHQANLELLKRGHWTAN